MIIDKIKILNFKNIENFEGEFSPKINCFAGMNGAGKTNILDAIHYLSFSKSFFHSLDFRNIRHGEEYFAIHGYFSGNNSADKISCVLKDGGKKQLSINDKTYKRFSDHIGKYPLIMISPYDQDLINLGSDIRRKFADMVISQFSVEYLDSLVSYNKILLQRNNLLKQLSETSSSDFTLIELLDEQLVSYGEVIHHYRKDFFSKLTPVFQKYFELISNHNEKVHLEYISQLNENNFIEHLRENRQKDLMVKYTTVGIHKDDISFFINDYSVKNYASQGQQKSYTIAMKLAQFEYIKQFVQNNPILLLDDIFDKLDAIRVENLISLVSDDNFGQVFITDTHIERFNEIMRNVNSEIKVFKIERK
ncbi:MAG: DNA replication/repair protein RecF [Bacteroidales bacterium]|jgi:DNA replication and repair protein RecF|nr:DNA replication/repair protein RecF [Bacteroidales bacterium]